MKYPYIRIIPLHVWKGKKVEGAIRYDVALNRIIRAYPSREVVGLYNLDNSTQDNILFNLPQL